MTADDIKQNLAAARELLRAAKAEGADFALLPENCALMAANRAEREAGAFLEAEHPAVAALAELAAELDLWVLAGSLAIRKEAAGRPTNRSLLLTPAGKVAARYDKIHLFDVAVPDGQVYRESATFDAGAEAVLAKLPWGWLGMSVCYDLRFPQLYRALAKAGADFLSVPAAFTAFTGQAHWHVLLRARAIETGCFVFAPAQCGVHPGSRQTYGHSLIVAPWGEVLADGGDRPGVVLARIEPSAIAAARGMIPALEHDRPFAAPQRLGARPQLAKVGS
jgi:predicted amidohydrolase